MLVTPGSEVVYQFCIEPLTFWILAPECSTLAVVP